MELVHGFVEVTHTDLSEVARVILVEQDAMVMETSCVTTASGMLPVFSNPAMASAHVASLLPVLLQSGRHGEASETDRQTDRQRDGQAKIASASSFLLLQKP